jgi:hypothetical protein
MYLYLTSIEDVHKKLWVSKTVKDLISRLLTWESQEKWHMGVAFVASHIKYFKGEGGGFSQVRAMVRFMSSCMHVAHLRTKNVSIMH